MTQPVEEIVEELSERDKALLGEGHRLLPLSANSGGLATFMMAKQGQGICYGFSVYNQSANAQWIFMMTPDTFQTSGATPLQSFPVAAKSLLSVDFGQVGRAFRQGFVLANSTTEATLTVGSANCIFDIQYV